MWSAGWLLGAFKLDDRVGAFLSDSPQQGIHRVCRIFLLTELRPADAEPPESAIEA